MEPELGLGMGALVRHLHAKGIPATERQIDFHIRNGHLPEPPRNTSGHRVWSSVAVAVVETFFQEKAQKDAKQGMRSREVGR